MSGCVLFHMCSDLSSIKFDGIRKQAGGNRMRFQVGVTSWRVYTSRKCRSAMFGPTVRADISPVRRRTEGPFAGWESGSFVGMRAESPRKSPPHIGPENLCGPTARRLVLFHQKPSPATGSACAAPVSGLGWYRLGPSARNSSENCVYSSGLKSTARRGTVATRQKKDVDEDDRGGRCLK